MAKTSIIYPTLRAEMARERLTIEDLAKHLGIARDTMSRKLSGKQKLLLSESSEIKKAFFPGIGLEELFRPEEERETA